MQQNIIPHIHLKYISFICSYNGTSQIKDAIKKADIIIVTAGVPRKPGKMIE